MKSTKQDLHDNNWSAKLTNFNKDSSELNESNKSIIALIPKIKSVLDVGCGSGELMLYLKAKGVRVQGVDISSVAVSLAKKKGLDVKQVDLDEGLPFKNNTFDCAISNQVLMHVFNPKKVLFEMKRISKKYVLINVPNHEYWRFRLVFLKGELPDVFSGEAAHIRFFTLKKARALVKQVGLKVIAEEYTGKKFMPSLLSTGFALLCEKE
ncbi:MAG: methionine biosynthesis protein MetW [archaeon]